MYYIHIESHDALDKKLIVIATSALQAVEISISYLKAWAEDKFLKNINLPQQFIERW